MQISLFNNAIRLSVDGSLLAQEIVAHGRNAIKGISFSYGPFGITSSESLVNRAVLLSAVVLTVATVFFRYRAAQNSDDRKECLRSCALRSVVLLSANMAGHHFVIACITLNYFIQFKYIYSILPYLNDPPSQPSLINRTCQFAYTAIKYAALAALTTSVFKACDNNLFNGVLFSSFAGLWYLTSDPVLEERQLPKGLKGDIIEAQLQKDIGSLVGAHVASCLLLTAIFSGVGVSILSGAVQPPFSGLDDFLRGLFTISCGFALIVPLIKKFYDESETLDRYSRELIKRFSFAVSKAQEVSRTFNIPLSPSHFNTSYALALEYIAKKTDPAVRHQLLREINKQENLIYFLENQPFLDSDEVDEFAKKIGGLQTFDLWTYLNRGQIERMLFPTKMIPLNADLLADIDAKVENLEEDLNIAISKNPLLEESEVNLSELAKAARKAENERKIYEEIQEKYKKILEYSLSIPSIVYSLNKMEPSSAESEEVREYVQTLKGFIPKLTALKGKIEALESAINAHTGELTVPAVEALGLKKGLREIHCIGILVELGQPHSETPCEDIARLLAERGVINLYDLVQKTKILLPEHTVDDSRAALIAFVKESLLAVPDSTWTDRAVRVADKIYRCVSFPFFTAIQFYLLPRTTTAGFLFGVLSSSFFPNNSIFRWSQRIMTQLSEGLDELGSWFPRISRIFFLISWHASVMKFYSTRIGIIPGCVSAIQLPRDLRVYMEYLKRSF